MSKALSMVLHVGTGTWSLGYVENHSARPMTKEELEAHIKEFNENKTQLSTEKSARENAELELTRAKVKVAHIENAMEAMRQRAEAAEKACASQNSCIASAVEALLSHESDVFTVPTIKTVIRILLGQEGGGTATEETVQVLPAKDSEQIQKQVGNSGKDGHSVPQKEDAKPDEVSRLLQDISGQASRESHAGLSQARPLQGKMPNGTSECHRVGEDFEAEEMFGVRLVGDDSRSSRRLLQAIRRCVALQHLSREEAQEILTRPDAGRDYIHRSEAEKWKERCIQETAFRVEDIQRSAKERQALESQLTATKTALRKCVSVMRKMKHPAFCSDAHVDAYADAESAAEQVLKENQQ